MNNDHFRATRGVTPESVWGWSDFRKGLPFRTGYDSWPRVVQRNYENGRLRAANTLAAFGEVPSRQAKRTFYMAAAVVGRASPDPRQRW